MGSAVRARSHLPYPPVSATIREQPSKLYRAKMPALSRGAKTDDRDLRLRRERLEHANANPRDRRRRKRIDLRIPDRRAAREVAPPRIRQPLHHVPRYRLTVRDVLRETHCVDRRGPSQRELADAPTDSALRKPGAEIAERVQRRHVAIVQQPVARRRNVQQQLRIAPD